MSNTSLIERSPVEVGGGPEESGPGPGRGGLRAPSLTTIVGLCLALGAWAVHLRPLLDNSFLWHLRAGHWILEHGIPREDIFSFTAAGTPWVVQSWLAEVVYAAVDRVAGPFGLQVLRAGLSAALTYSMFRLATRLCGHRVRALVVTIPAVAAGFLMWSERPLLFGALALMVLVWLVEVPASFPGRAPLVALPVLFWFWANSHGSFALGFAYLGVHGVGRWLDGAPPWRGRERRLLIAAALALAACLLNPLGIELLTFPVHLLSRGEVMQEIVEWQSLSFQSLHGMLFGAFAVVTALSLCLGAQRPSRRDVVVSVTFLTLALWASRNVVVAPIVCLPIVARRLAVREGSDDRRPPIHWAVLAALFAVAGAVTLKAAEKEHYSFELYPTEAMQAVEDEGLLGRRLLTTDGWGGFVIHQYWPRQEVFIDDRYDMYPPSLARDYFDLDAGRPGWDQTLGRRDIEVVVWPVDKPLAELLDLAPAWQRIHQDDLAGVWMRV